MMEAREIAIEVALRLPNIKVGYKGPFVTVATKQPRLIAIGPLDELEEYAVNECFMSGMPVAILHEPEDLNRALRLWCLDD